MTSRNDDFLGMWLIHAQYFEYFEHIALYLLNNREKVSMF